MIPEPVKIKVEEDTIPKKIAAIEVHKKLRTIMFLGFYSMAAAAIPVIFASITPWAGSGAAIVFCGLAAIVGAKAIREIKTLEYRYHLKK